MPTLKQGTMIPTHDETEVINAGIAADVDARELDSQWHKGAKLACEAFSPEIYTALVAMKRPEVARRQTKPRCSLPFAWMLICWKPSRPQARVGKLV